MGPLHHFTFKVNVQYLINTISPCIFNLLNYTVYYICLKLLYLYILSISILQIVDIALQAELKITMLPPCLGQHFIFSEIISHLCILVLNTLMCLFIVSFDPQGDCTAAPGYGESLVRIPGPPLAATLGASIAH